MQRQKEIVKISVGAQAINELLGGGIESRCITEIYGEFRCSQSHQKSVSLTLSAVIKQHVRYRGTMAGTSSALECCRCRRSTYHTCC